MSCRSTGAFTSTRAPKRIARFRGGEPKRLSSRLGTKRAAASRMGSECARAYFTRASLRGSSACAERGGKRCAHPLGGKQPAGGPNVCFMCSGVPTSFLTPPPRDLKLQLSIFWRPDSWLNLSPSRNCMCFQLSGDPIRVGYSYKNRFCFWRPDSWLNAFQIVFSVFWRPDSWLNLYKVQTCVSRFLATRPRFSPCQPLRDKTQTCVFVYKDISLGLWRFCARARRGRFCAGSRARGRARRGARVRRAAVLRARAVLRAGGSARACGGACAAAPDSTHL